MTIGRLLKESSPDVFGNDDENDLTATAVEHLSDPARRPAMLRLIRTHAPDLKDLPEQELVDSVVKTSGKGTAINHTAPQGPTPEEMKQQRNDVTAGGARKAWNEVNRKILANEGAEREGLQPHSDTFTEKAADFRHNVPHPDNAIPENGDTPPRMPVYDDPREFDRMVKQQGASKHNHFLGLSPTTAQDSEGKAIGELDPMASQSTRDTEGWNGVKYVTGEADPLQQGITSVARKFFDPVTGRAGDQFAGEQDSRPKGMPQMGVKVSKGAELGEPTGPTWQPGYGFREYAGDTMEQLGAANPEASLFDAKAMGHVSKAWLRGMQGIDKGEAALSRLVGWDSEAKSNEDEAKVYGQKADEINDWQDFIKTATPAARKESAKLAGRYQGHVVGSTASMLTPTGAGNAVKKVGGAALEAVPDAIKDPVRKFATEKVVEPIRRAAADSSFAPLFSNKSAKVGVANPAARDTIDAMDVTKRTAAGRFEEGEQTKLMEAFDPIFKAHNADEKTQKEALREMLEKWTTREGRESASPMVKSMMDVAQPIHEARWAPGVKEMGKEYNPYHPLWGQDPTKAARMTETATARAQEEAGNIPWEGAHYTPAEHGAVPGIRKLSPETVGGAKEWRGARPIDEIMNNTVAHMQAKGMTHAEQQSLVKDFKEMNFVTAYARSSRVSAMDNAAKNTAMAQELVDALPQLQKEAPHQYRTFQDLENEIASTGAPGVTSGKNAYGSVVHGDTRMGQTMENHLKQNDLKVIHVQGQPRLPGSAWEKQSVELPAEFAQLHGQVVDRHFAQAIEQLSADHGVRAALGKKTTGYGMAKSWAEAWDRTLGLAQSRRSITAGNAGFVPRVLTADLGRHAVSEGLEGSTPEIRAMVAELSEIPEGATTAAARQQVRWGDRVLTKGQLADELRQYGNLKASFTNQALKREHGALGSGTLVQKASDVVGKVIPGAEKRIPQAIDLGAEAAALPGKASAAGSDVAFRQMFNVNGRKLHPGWTAGEGIRAMNMLSQMKRGVSPQVAGQKMRMLMVDNGDTNIIQEGLKPFIPFIKFYSSGMQGALEIAAKNPRRFSRLADLSKLIERNDAALHNGAIDPRNKDKGDAWAGLPAYESAGRLMSGRIENPLTDTADIAESAYNTATGAPGQGVGKYLSSFMTRPYQLGTGRDAVTGRSILGVDDEDMKRLPKYGLLGQWQEAKKLGLLGESPNLAGAYAMMKNLPGTSQMMTGPVDTAARQLSGLQGSSASRTQEDKLGELQRASQTMTWGGRQHVLNTRAALLHAAKEAGKDIAEPQPKHNAKKIKQGKMAPPEDTR